MANTSTASARVNLTNRRWTFPDKFSFATGLFGLIADAIALVVFVSQTFNAVNAGEQLGQQSLPSSFALFIMFLVLIYSWLALSWFLVRRHIQNITPSQRGGSLPVVREDNFVGKSWRVTIAIGMFTLPLWIVLIFYVGVLSSSPFALSYGGSVVALFLMFGIFPAAAIVFGMVTIITTLLPIVYGDFLAQ
jgi:putative effector of murein hydrolase LrgA (UPF0299 family)